MGYNVILIKYGSANRVPGFDKIGTQNLVYIV
jgi:hypothetical protein